jgi:hypothetical protein
MIEPYQQRVIDEKRELDEKITKLDAFLNTATFDALDDAEQNRMNCQEDYMISYSRVLGERIAAFK